MDEVIKGKIRVITSLFEGFKKRLSTFENVAKEFKDSVLLLNLQISDFDEDFKSAKLFHSEIIAGSSEGMPEYDSYMQKKVFDAISNIYFKHSTTLHGLLKIAMSGEELNATAYPQAANFSTHPNAISYSAFDMNWSYIQGSVPNFDGSYEKWTEFMDSYKSYVHDNDSLSDCAKLKILNSLLKGDALKVVKREFGTLKACDYEQIWEKLTQRYNHKKTIVYAYFQELFFQSSFEKETASNLKTIYDVSYDSVQALKNLGLATEQWGDILLSELSLCGMNVRHQINFLSGKSFWIFLSLGLGCWKDLKSLSKVVDLTVNLPHLRRNFPLFKLRITTKAKPFLFLKLLVNVVRKVLMH